MIVLREMRWWDIEPVLDLENELFPEDAWSAGMFWSELADARHPGATRWYTVAEAGDGRIVGYAGLMAIAGEGDVQTIAVAQDHWGDGLGTRLLDRAGAAGRRGRAASTCCWRSGSTTRVPSGSTSASASSRSASAGTTTSPPGSTPW